MSEREKRNARKVKRNNLQDSLIAIVGFIEENVECHVVYVANSGHEDIVKMKYVVSCAISPDPVSTTIVAL